MTVTDTVWDADRLLLSTRLHGVVTVAEVRQWQAGLTQVLARLPDGIAFKTLVNLSGYEPGDLDAHKAMRSIVPLTLAAHGFRTALLDLFDPVDLPVQATRGVTCVAVAHVHHDAGKMDEYERRLGRANERFFVDARRALDWLSTIPVEREE